VIPVDPADRDTVCHC